jgi:hypothetical protein
MRRIGWLMIGVVTLGGTALRAQAASILVNFDSLASGAAANEAVAGLGFAFELGVYRPELDSLGDPIPGSEAYRPDPEPFDLVRVDDPSTPPGYAGYGNAPSGPNALDAIDQGVLISFASPVDLTSFSIALDLSTLGFPGTLDIVFQDASGGVLGVLPTEQSVAGFVAARTAPLQGVGSIYLPSGAFYDDLQLTTPEPAMLLLLGAGLAALAGLRARMSWRTTMALLAITLASSAQAAPIGVRISEWMYSSATSGPEFIEITNFGPAAVDFTGWSYDDDSRIPGSLDLSAFGVVEAGESVIITESDAATFRILWGLSLDVGVIGGNTVNIGRNDELNIFDASSALVDRLTYGDQNLPGTIRTQGRSGIPASEAALGVNNAALWVLASAGDAAGSYASTQGDVGNPGLAPVLPEPAAAALILLASGLLIARRAGSCR